MSQKRNTTNTPGISYRLHPTRKHGVNFDRYYSIRFSIKNQRQEEGVGWASEGWTEKKVAILLSEIKGNITRGQGPRSLREMRAEEDERREKEEIKQLLNTQKILDNVFPMYCDANKHKSSLKDEIGYFNNWISPAIGHKQLDQITLYDLDEIMKSMEAAGRSVRTINYVKAVIRQTYNFAIRYKLFTGEPPTKDFYLGRKADNKRKKYLTPNEAALLLEEIKKRSVTIYRMCLLSLYTGMRFGEVAKLKWQDLTLQESSLTAVDTKNGESRHVYLNEDALEMLKSLPPGRPGGWVFPNSKGNKMGQISRTFERAVKALNMNEGITDGRMKVVQHTLRHTYASWLRKYAGADIMVIKEALGHKTLAMTIRYTKVDDDDIRQAVANIKPIESDKINQLEKI